jgi:hypothetical protein
MLDRKSYELATRFNTTKKQKTRRAGSPARLGDLLNKSANNYLLLL